MARARLDALIQVIARLILVIVQRVPIIKEVEEKPHLAVMVK